MKTIGIIGSGLLVALSALGQGTVNFASTGAQIFWDAAHGGAAVQAGAFTVGLYYGVSGTTDPFTLALLKTTTVGPVAGRFLGGTVTTPATTAPGASAVFEIRTWSIGYASYEEATASGLDTVFIGRSGLFNNPTGNPNSVPPGTPAGLTFANVSFIKVPEPSLVCLSLLGAGAVFLLRRRRD